MSIIISVIIFLAVLFVLILVHEWGHYITAKLTGMRVDEFGIGFPPKLLSFKRGETNYTLNALPVGGFVKIYGENPEELDNESIDLHVRARAFGARPKWAQIVVLLAGVTMNMALAWFLLFAILLMGVQSAVEEGKQGDEAKLIISAVLPDSPADRMSLPVNSEILAVAVGEDKLSSLLPTAFSHFMITNNDVEVSITYSYKNKTNTVLVSPTVGVLSSSSTQPAIGVALALVEVKHYAILAALQEASLQTINLTKGISVGLGNLIKGVVAGTADYSQVTGPIGIVGYVGEAAAVGLTSLLYFMAMISVNLAIINLLPVPALDGGRIIFVIIEAMIRRPLDPLWAGRVNLVGFIFLMLLMLLVTVHDVLRLW